MAEKSEDVKIEPGPDKTVEGTVVPAATPPAASVPAAGDTPDPAVVDDKVAVPVAEPVAAKPEPEDWRDKRIATLTARLKAQETAKPTPAEPEPTGAPALTQADVERLANERAGAISARAEFNARCNSVAQEGRKQFPDFDVRVKELAKIVDNSNPAERKAYDDFLEAALETGEAPKLIYELGGDLNEAMRILALPPTKRAIELAQRAIGIDPGVSGLPKPITTVQGKNTGPSEIAASDPVRADKLSSSEWHKRREAELASQKPAYGRRQTGAR